MNCPNCGSPIGNGVKFCASCGAPVPAAQPQPVAASVQPQPAYQPVGQPQKQDGDYGKILSPWAFFGYSVLFAIPVVGFILLIVFSVMSDNICRRNFARSYFIIYVIIIVLFIITMLFGIGASVMDSIQSY